MNPVDERDIEILEIVGVSEAEPRTDPGDAGTRPDDLPSEGEDGRLDQPLSAAGTMRQASSDRALQVGRIRAAATRDATLAVLRELLEPLDALESCIRDEPDHESLRGAVRMALRDLWDVFRRHELERIEGDLVEFDPAVHDAVEVVPTDRVPQGTVLKVLRVGYTLGGELVRPAMVRVAGPPRDGAAKGREETA